MPLLVPTHKEQWTKDVKLGETTILSINIYCKNPMTINKYEFFLLRFINIWCEAMPYRENLCYIVIRFFLYRKVSCAYIPYNIGADV